MTEALDVYKMLKDLDDGRKRRAKIMPDDAVAISAMFEAYDRLRELGWQSIIYCPKDGTVFDAIEAGSTGIHPCHYDGEWPQGSFWLHDGGDLWPGRPVLFKLRETT